MRNLFRWASRRRFPYEPLISIEISKSRLLNNLNEFRKIAPGGMVAPVLKSNAYGHGLREISEILEDENWAHGPNRGHRIPFFVVDSYFEAIALRSQGIKTHLLIIGYTRPETIKSSRGQNTAFTVTSLDMLKKIGEIRYAPWDWETGSGTGRFTSYLPRAKRSHRIHLKIDTGMHRQGLLPEELSEAIEIIKASPSIILEGICSHLSDADNTDETFTESQIGLWNKTVKQFKHEFPSLKFIHLSNTDGHRYSKDIEANVSRLGIGLYGLAQNPNIFQKLNILPVLEMKTVISGVKKLRLGDKVGYSNTFVATKDMFAATIPVGYFEGLDRRLSNIGSVQVLETNMGRVTCPIIGRVSMNITSLDITQACSSPTISPKIGDQVIVISKDNADLNSINSMAKLCNTISYEIAIKIPAHLKRVVVD